MLTDRSSVVVEILFLMYPQNVKRLGLDKSAKPVLDTIFKSRYPQVKDPYLTRALFDVDDDQVVTRVLKKTGVVMTSKKGAEITIT